LLQYADVQSYLEPKLVAKGYDPLPVFDPGPGSFIDAIDVSPDMLIIITPWPGGGLDSEAIFDRAAIQLRTVGPQMDYAKAEQLAIDCDQALISFALSQLVNEKWWLSVQRAGGSPALLQKDDGDRYHFYCNYIVEVEYG
jgi:hypothetical protein